MSLRRTSKDLNYCPSSSSFLLHSPKKKSKKNPKNFRKKIPKKSKKAISQKVPNFENIQFPTWHLEAKNPFGLVFLAFWMYDIIWIVDNKTIKKSSNRAYLVWCNLDQANLFLLFDRWNSSVVLLYLAQKRVPFWHLDI